MPFVFGEVDAKVTSAALPAGAATEARLEAVRSLLAGTVATSAASLPLPAGASTEVKLEAVRALLAGSATEAKLEQVRALLAGPLDTELPAAAAPGDADANAAVPAVAGRGQLWNGTGWERKRGNGVATTLLGVADRSGIVVAPSMPNMTGTGIFLGLQVTTAGAGNLRLLIRADMPGQTSVALLDLLWFTGGPVTAPSWYGFELAPGLPVPGHFDSVGGRVRIRQGGMLPRSFRVDVWPSDPAAIWTYSLTAAITGGGS